MNFCGNKPATLARYFPASEVLPETEHDQKQTDANA